MKCIMTGLLACGLMLGLTTISSAADPGAKVQTPKGFRMSKLRGDDVKNLQGEKLGTVEDFVINADNATINYMAFGTGGVLGLGEKLFAVPFDQVKMTFDGSNIFFVVNISKATLKNSKGFDKDAWPDNAPAGFAGPIDRSAATPKPGTRQ